jgi:hypothetical protein
MNPWYTAAWIAFGVGILAVELVAVFNRKRGDTLSEHIWAWIGMDRKTRIRCARCSAPKEHLDGVGGCWRYQPAGFRSVSRWTWTRRLFTLMFVLWLGIHLFTGGWL